MRSLARSLGAFGPIVLGACVLSGCAYQPDSFSYFGDRFAGQRTTVGCLDISVERRREGVDGHTVLAYEFGNRCDRPAVVDLAKAGVVGRTTYGRDVKLVAFDPRAEIRATRLDGRAVGSEAIAYTGSVAVSRICVDAASITHMSPAVWLCL